MRCAEKLEYYNKAVCTRVINVQSWMLKVTVTSFAVPEFYFKMFLWSFSHLQLPFHLPCQSIFKFFFFTTWLPQVAHGGSPRTLSKMTISFKSLLPILVWWKKEVVYTAFFYSRSRLLSTDVGIFVKCIACGHEFRSRFQEDRIETYQEFDFSYRQKCPNCHFDIKLTKENTYWINE